MAKAVNVLPDPAAMAKQAAQHVMKAAKVALSRRQRFHLVLSGGSTPAAVYRLLALEAFPWENVSLYWGDERLVPHDDPVSNFGMARREWFSKVPNFAARLFPIDTGRGSVTICADAYQSVLQDELGLGGRMDLILLGLGDDGHTASLFPEMPSLAEKERWVVGTPPGVLPPPVDRITMTLPLINRSREVLFLVSGPGKAAIVKRILEPSPVEKPLPAGQVGSGATLDQVTWLLDQDAAGQIIAHTGKNKQNRLS